MKGQLKIQGSNAISGFLLPFFKFSGCIGCMVSSCIGCMLHLRLRREERRGQLPLECTLELEPLFPGHERWA